MTTTTVVLKVGGIIPLGTILRSKGTTEGQNNKAGETAQPLPLIDD